MKTSLRVGLAQINPIVGDLSGNAELILGGCEKAIQENCDLILFPELCLTGYPPEDLLLKPSFVKENLATLKQIASKIKTLTAIVGFVDFFQGQRYNAAAVIEKGKIKTIYRKNCLPNYGVFDENRYFSAGKKPVIFSLSGFRIGVTICEDIWIHGPHLKALKSLKPDFVANISASPFHADKINLRKKVFKKTATFLQCPLLFCNLVGGQDELVFDGGSFVIQPNGQTSIEISLFKPDFSSFEIKKVNKKIAFDPSLSSKPPLTPIEQIHQALILGIKDYVGKNGFKKVALGVSGGIDSALVAALAVEALSPEQVICVTMPSQFNSSATIHDAKLLAQNIGSELLEIPIQTVHEKFLSSLAPIFNNQPPDVTEENLQARVRGSLLMALSNKFGWLILTTGNKSELSTGYCTLYGDTAGGFSVLKDVLKTTVYKLAEEINKKAGKEIIPHSTITRAPTAELKNNQKDEDTLGLYKDLDPLIKAYVEENKSLSELLQLEPRKEAYVRRILSLIDRNEYKRRQAPLGIKITPRAFGRDYRMPITNRYRPSK